MVDNLIYRYSASPRDGRDRIYEPSTSSIPVTVDLRKWDSLVEDQGYLGSCSGQAVSSAYELLLKKTASPLYNELSEMFIYYNARVIDDIVEYDDGANLRSALLGLRRWGVCSDDLWPYDVLRFNVKPPEECYVDARPRVINWFQRIAVASYVRNAIAEGWSVVIGTEIWSSMLSIQENDNIMSTVGSSLGYHAMTVVAYDDNTSLYTIKNSWGDDWGMRGYCYMPYQYMEDSVFERWIFDYRQI